MRRLEYRGYDSAGVAVVERDGLRVERRAGKLANLVDALAEDLRTEDGPWRGTTGIGHTRWATHGGPTDANAHPHVDCTGTIAVIHNGIIENFAQLREELENRGHAFGSDTDTEVVAHLLEEQMGSYDDPAQASIADALRAVCNQLTGAFTLVVTAADEPGLVVAARRQLPARGRPRQGPSRSSRAMSPPSSPTPATRSRSARTRSSSCGPTACWSPTSQGCP